MNRIILIEYGAVVKNLLFIAWVSTLNSRQREITHKRIGRAFAIAILICICAVGPAPGADPVADVLSMVEQSMRDPGVGWTGEQQRDYLDTIRQALSDDHDKPDYTSRIEIFRRGFPAFWSRRQTSQLTQAEYDMFKAEIRWFCETLIAEEPASVSERALLKSQIRDLCDYATEHLRAQFPFLTAACVEQGKTAALKEFDHELENPLVPIFRRPFSQDQMKVIKSNWARSYKRWYSFWRNIRYSTVDREDLSDPKDLTNHPHYKFVKRCLSYLPQAIWPTVGKPPKYVIDAALKLREEKAEKTRAYRKADKTEINLAIRFLNQVEQVEQWSFVFTALLETAILDENRGPSSANPQKGGDSDGLTKQP